MIKPHLSNLLADALASHYKLPCPPKIEVPSQRDRGDYASNLAFTLAKSERKAPPIIAEEIVEKLSADPTLSEQFGFSALNGFVNITLKDATLWTLFANTLTSEPAPLWPGRKVLLEYVSANPTGPLHIGHGRWAVLGSVIQNLLNAANVDVDTEFYINDLGNQIQKLKDSVEAAKAGKPIPEDGYHGHYIQDIAASGQDPLQYNLDDQKRVLSSMNVTFDTWFSEKSLYDKAAVQQTLDALAEKQLSYEEEGALWFKSSDFGDEKDRVLIKGDGAYTYFLVDIAYHYDKLLRGFDKLINIFGADHHGYLPRLKAGTAALGGDAYLKDDAFMVVIGQLVSLKRDGEPVRMSKRTGEMITLEEVIDDIGQDALRYFLAEKSADTHVDFDLAVAKKQSSENPVFYVQYAHARLCNVLQKAKDQGLQPSETQPLTTDLAPKEKALLLHAIAMQDQISEAAAALAPHKWVHYCYEFARAIQHFYEACPVLSAEPDDQAKRLYMVKQCQLLLAKSLSLLSISAPERM